MESIILGSGCFWCTEAVFSSLKGINEVIPGYSGGTAVNPSYEEVCTGKTGHAEVVKVTYDPEAISTENIIEIFFRTHDPTTLNRQGADVGTQYRSTIICMNETQRAAAKEIISEMEREKVYDKPIVTIVESFRNFYPAEEYHRRYFEKNPNQGYCRVVIAPKMEKFRKIYSEHLKSAR